MNNIRILAPRIIAHVVAKCGGAEAFAAMPHERRRALIAQALPKGWWLDDRAAYTYGCISTDVPYYGIIEVPELCEYDECEYTGRVSVFETWVCAS